MNKIEFYKETEFKETPIGKIPKDWRSVKLREVAGVRGNKNISGFEKVAFIPMELISETKIYADYHVKASNEIKSYIYCEAGDILLAKITPSLENGKQGIVPFDIPNRFALATTEVFPIYCREIDRFFLFYILKFPKFRNKIIASMTGTTGRQRASKESVENLDIPFPPIVEQRAVAGVLSVVDLAIQRTDMVIAKTERLKKGLMQTLLTRGIGHKEFKDTEIGKIPKTWQTVKLGEALELCQYGLSIPMKDYGRYPIIRMDEIIDGYVIPQITKYVDLDDETFRSFKLEKGDILFNRTNAYELVGRTGIFLLDGDYVFASYLIRLRPKHEIFDPHFLTYYLIFSQDRLRQLATKAVHQANINATNLKKFTIPKPPLEEQQKIASIIFSVDQKLEFERKEKIRLEMIKQGLMDLLLTGKIRVKVN